MKVCVVGAGAIGSLFAAHLAKVTEVAVLTRREEHARALNEHGLRVSGRHDFTARLTAATAAFDLPDFGLGIIATKSITHALADAAAIVPDGWVPRFAAAQAARPWKRSKSGPCRRGKW